MLSFGFRFTLVFLAGLFVLPLTDHSGQDDHLFGLRAHYYGQLADHEFFTLGRIPEALDLYEHAYRAMTNSDPAFQARFLNNIGAMQLSLFRYQEAAQTLLRVRKSTAAAHDDALLGSADGNLAALSAQMDDLPTAEMYARESLQAYSRREQPELRLRALLTLANIMSRERLVPDAEIYFLAGIRAATSLRDWDTASYGWQHYGKVLLEDGELEDAERALNESLKLTMKSTRKKGQDALLWNISRLRLRQHNPVAALESINSAIQASETAGRIPLWRLYQTRAEAQLATGNAAAALADARTALQQARMLRANVVPDNDSRVGSEGLLDEVYSVLIDAGNQVYLKNHDRALLRETFEAAEENRSESLEALLPTASGWRSHLPAPQYWDKLSELISAQRTAVRVDSAGMRERINRLHAELSEMEASAKGSEQASVGTVLARVQKKLPKGASLLSFRLSEPSSWLWTVNHGELKLYRLKSKRALLIEIRDFQHDIRKNHAERIAQTGCELYANLFGGLPRSLERNSQWFISADEPLYALPLAALVAKVSKKGPVYLTERMPLLILPGAQLLDSPMNGSLVHKRFVVAGDGIYNRADPRYGGAGPIRPASWSMARLPGSGAEIRLAANLWPGNALLTGSQMTRRALLREIDRNPDVIHIASHVIAGQERWRAGILALGMGDAGEPELLTPQEILLHPIQSRLVVMTGCSSGFGDSLPASGLMGLTRAWLAAGAGEVLATRWPTRDEGQDGLIGSFYRHLLASPDGNIPQALQAARKDMIARGGWRAEPRYWSSFFLIGVR